MRLNAGICAGVCLFLAMLTVGAHAAPPKNVIFFIGDGMGKEAIKAAGFYKGAALAMENGFPYTNTITTHAADAAVTDSAAAATALATGVKVNNLAISLRLPGDGSDLETVLEIYKAAGKSTGLVTTRFLTDATPACFAAHTSTRYDTTTIANDYLNVVRPNVLLGGGGNNLTAGNAQSAGYTVVTDRASMQAVNVSNVTHLCGLFGSDSLPYEINGLGALPHLTEMTDTALAMMQKNTNGFFLMIEGGLIDIAGHGSDIATQVRETLEFDRCVAKGLLWASNRNDTLIIVTADHECGGLTNVIDNGVSNNPTATWTGGGGHTATPVIALAAGERANEVSNVTDNTHFFPMILDIEPIVPVDYDGSNRLTSTTGWHYFKGTSEPPGTTTAWRTLGYTNVASWPTGGMPFRFGDGSNGTYLTDMNSNYVTLYLRQNFTITNPASIGALKLGIDYDDAAIVWINGQQVFASTSAPGSTAYNSLATTGHESSLGTGGPATTNILTNTSYLVAGTNVIAIQGFNLALTNSDFVLGANLYVSSYVMPPAGGDWRYLPGTNYPPGGTSAWLYAGYDPSAWTTSTMPIGYGDVAYGTQLTNMFGQYSTVYARRDLVITNLDDAAILHFTIDFDDGLVIWLNGQALYEANAPSNRSYQALATTSHESSVGPGNTYEVVVQLAYTNTGLLQTGTNIIAVYGLNSGTNSSDFYLNIDVDPAAAPDSDADEDGMSDAWEVAHFGTTVIASGGPNSDHDNDGLRDLYEYRAGTDPTNSVSALEVMDTRATGQYPVVTWQSASNRYYGVFVSTNLRSGWLLLAPTNIQGTPPINVYTDSASTNAIRFYRIRLND